MELDKVFIVDIECNGFLDSLDFLHVMSVGWITNEGLQIKSTPKDEKAKKDAVKKVFENPNNTIVGHYFLGFDIRALKKIYPDIDYKATIIDTLPISWYLYNERSSHGLESWGEDLGTKKEEVSDEEWKNLSYERAVERCESDVKINTSLWVKSLKLLRELYGNDEEIKSKIKLLNYKIELQVIQEENRILLDVEQCEKNLEILEKIIKEKVETLKEIMPKIPKIVKRTKPKNCLKKDGSKSVAGERWFTLLKMGGLPEEYEGEVEEIVDWETPNPQSTKQVKDFLFSRNWKPKLFKPGANGDVPQLRDDNKNLCKSIVKMFDEFPELEALQGLSVAQHRASYLKAFLETRDENDMVTASWRSIAKTWRCKHVKPIVNLPSNNSQYGEYVRSVLVAPKGKIFVNADLSSLEDKTKQCCIYNLDPKYVEELNVPGYDAHIAIGLQGGFISQAEAEFFKWYKKEDKSRKDLDFPESFNAYSDEELSEQFARISKVRKNAKIANYSCTYGASAKKIAESGDMTLKEGEALHKAFWDKNWSVRKFADNAKVKNVDGRNWIYNPFSRTWLLLTSDHIKFSAINQNYGAYIFDLWVFFMIQQGVKPIMSIHDEISFYINEGEEEKTKKVVQNAIDKVNKVMNMPIKFEAEPEFAKSYGDVH